MTQPIVDTLMGSHYPDQIATALGVSYVINFLTKCDKFKFLTAQTSDLAKIIVGLFAAVATATGVHIVVEGNFFTEAGVHLSIVGLSFNVVKDSLFQWICQQGWYDGLVKGS